MSAEGVFKTSVFGGFDKQSVLTYVDDLIAQQQQKENELQKNADAATAERDRLNDQVAQLTEHASALEEEVEKGKRAQTELAAKNARVTELEDALRRERERAAQLEQQLNQARERAAQLERQLSQSDERAHKYDDVISQVGLVMVEAQNQADVIIGRARRQADSIAQESMERLYGLSQRVDDMQADVTQARTVAARTFEEVDRRFAELEGAIRETQGHLYISAGVTAQAQSDEREELPEQPEEAQSGDFFEPAGTHWANG